MSPFFQDVRYAVRTFAANPGFTLAAVVTLALGIGASTAMFSVVYGVVLRALPFPDSDELVMVHTRARDRALGEAVSPGGFLDWQAQSRSFRDMAAFMGQNLTLTGRGEPELLTAAAVTVRFFDTLRIPAAIGRTFVAEEGQDGRSDVVVLSDALWRRRFAADPAIVGKPVTLDGRPFTVVGIMPPRVSFPEEVLGPPGRFRAVRTVHLWTPFIPQPEDRGNAYLKVFARLEPTVTPMQAQSDMTTFMQGQAADARFERFGPPEAVVAPLHEYVVGDIRRLLLLFLGAVGFVLLVACVNVANLLVARAAGRQKEVSVRSALGASRGRLVRQFLTESALLALLGGAGGLVLAVWGMDAFVSLIPRGSVPRLAEVDLNLSVLGFTFVVSVACGVLFGLAPVVHTARTNVQAAVKDAGATQSAGLGVLNVLVAVEVAFAVILLSGAGLLIKSFVQLADINPGFERANVMTASVTLPEASYPTPARMRAFYEEVLERLSNAPGVTTGVVNWLPFGGNVLSGDITVEAGSAGTAWAVKPSVSPDYFRAMNIPLVRGRMFTDADTALSPAVVMVTERFANRVWPGQDALGERVRLWSGQPTDQTWASVVGVVKDVRQTSLDEDGMPAVYAPLAQAPRPFLLNAMTLVVRSDAEPVRLPATIRGVIRSVDPNLAISRMERLDTLIAWSVSEPRFRSVLLGVFAAVALALVATGLLGVLMYAVTRRTKEIGIRIALGARPDAVAGLVVRQALAVTFVGLMVGLGGAFALTRLLRTLLFGVEPTDPSVFALAAIFLVAVAFAAAYLPARRAARVDPLVALRYE